MQVSALSPDSRRAAALLLTASLLATGSTAAQPTLRFDHLTNEDGLLDASIFCAVEDDRGFLWFGSQSGLHRYDGREMRVFEHLPGEPQSLSNSWVETVALAPDGALWIGTGGRDTGLDRYDPRSDTYAHYRHDPADPGSLSSDEVMAVHVDRSGTVWAGTTGGLDRLAPAASSFEHYRHDPGDDGSLGSNAVRTLLEDRDGALWVGTLDAGLDRLDRETGGFVHYRHDPNDPASLASDQIWTLHEDRNRVLWVGTRGGGLHRFDPRSGGFTRYQHDPENPTSLSSNDIAAIHDDREGKLWVVTWRSGVNRLDPDTGVATRYRHDPKDSSSISTDEARGSGAILEDRSGAIWLGLSNSVAQVDPSRETFRVYRHDPDDPTSLSHPRVFGMHEDRDRFIWIATHAGLDRLDPRSGDFTHYRHDPNDPASLGPGVVMIPYEDRSGVLWVGVKGSGLYRLDRATGAFQGWRHDPDDPTSLSNDFPYAIHEDRAGRFWVGTKGGLNRLDRATGAFSRYQNDPDDSNSLVHDHIRYIHEDRQGALWLGTAAGLSRFDPDTERFANYRPDVEGVTSLSHGFVTSIQEDRSGQLWIGTLGGGVNRLDPATGRFHRYTKGGGASGGSVSVLPDNTVSTLFEDRQGRWWMSTNVGIARLDPVSGRVTAYDLRDGLQGMSFNSPSGVKARSGVMWFGGGRGVNAFQPERMLDNPYLPPVVITSIKLFQEELEGEVTAPYLDELELEHDQNFFSFEFAALSFWHPERNRYQYKLEGLDADWVDAGAQRFASYTSVPSGDYVFRVRGSNNDGLWNEEGAALRIAIAPPWWQTWWFRAIAGALALVLLWFANRVQRSRVKSREALRWAADVDRQNEALAAKNLELGEKNVEVEEKNAAILQQQTQLVQAEKMASLGQLVAGVAHEINNPINFISSGLPSLRRDVDKLGAMVPEEARDVRYTKVHARTGKLLSAIEDGASRTATIVKDLRSFSRLDEAELKFADLHQALDATLTLLNSQIRDRVEVVKNYGDIPEVEGYIGQLNQVFMNLLTNAIQAIEGTGTITITTERSGDDHVRIVIGDTGGGMTEEVRQKIFDPFFTTKDVGQGTGLGLSISHGIIEKHAGTIAVTSEIGRGTEFTIRLPLRPTKTAE